MSLNKLDPLKPPQANEGNLPVKAANESLPLAREILFPSSSSSGELRNETPLKNVISQSDGESSSAATQRAQEQGNGFFTGVKNACGRQISRVLGTGSGIRTKMIQGYINHFASSLQKNDLLKIAADKIASITKNRHFFELAMPLTKIIAPLVESNISSNGWWQENFHLQKDLFGDLVEINLANGLANLVVNMEEKKEEIPNYHAEDPIANLITLICTKGAKHLQNGQLEAVEDKFRLHHQEFKSITDKLFSIDPELSPKQKVDLANQRQQNLVKLLKGLKEKQSLLILAELFPDIPSDLLSLILSGKTIVQEKIQKHSDSRLQDIFNFVRLSKDEIKRQTEIRNLFLPLIDELFLFLYPNKFKDVVMPLGGVISTISPIQNRIYGAIRDSFAELLTDMYLPMENHEDQLHEWKSIISKRTNNAPVDPILAAPSALLVGLTHNYIQSSPNFVTKVSSLLEKASEPIQNDKTIQNEEMILCRLF